MSKVFFLLNLTTIYLFNASFVTFLALIFFISGFEDISIEISLMQSYIAFITLALSSHSRSIIVSDSNMYKLINEFSFRLKISLLVLLSVIIFFYSFVNEENFSLIISISSLLLLQWIFELNIAKAEIKKDKKFIFKNSTYIFFFILTFLVFFLQEYFQNYKYLIYIIIIYISYQILKNSLLTLFTKSKIRDNLYNSFKELSVISSSSLFFVNFLWKFIIIFWFGKIFAATIFVIFSISSFISTAYNNSFGYTLLKKKESFLSLFVIYIILILILIYNVDLFIFYIPDNMFIINDPIIYFKDTIIYSFVGSCFMLVGQFFRSIILFEKIYFRKFLFITDIIYSFLLLIYLLLLILTSGVENLRFLFLLSGITNFILYFLIRFFTNKKLI